MAQVPYSHTGKRPLPPFPQVVKSLWAHKYFPKRLCQLCLTTKPQVFLQNRVTDPYKTNNQPKDTTRTHYPQQMQPYPPHSFHPLTALSGYAPAGIPTYTQPPRWPIHHHSVPPRSSNPYHPSIHPAHPFIRQQNRNDSVKRAIKALQVAQHCLQDSITVLQARLQRLKKSHARNCVWSKGFGKRIAASIVCLREGLQNSKVERTREGFERAREEVDRRIKAGGLDAMMDELRLGVEEQVCGSGYAVELRRELQSLERKVADWKRYTERNGEIEKEVRGVEEYLEELEARLKLAREIEGGLEKGEYESRDEAGRFKLLFPNPFFADVGCDAGSTRAAGEGSESSTSGPRCAPERQEEPYSFKFRRSDDSVLLELIPGSEYYGENRSDVWRKR
ncbi:hypothetical protein BJ508DRAFT_309461 [Ascobolus immersus RN42]|uniref:Uncharacterized protein n=1 Tax=Ascobolus immersus RN42 TaxID=1160509 RepID=A0A3N4HWG9_ASCIM|nr:hypothetical protein BJ508DRAFT_309461 [Ascobolus immersus RN42]